MLLEEAKGENRLRRVLGSVGLSSLGVGAIIGAGIFVSTGAIAKSRTPFRAPLVPLVPVLGIVTCSILMFSLPAYNWVRLAIWLGLGFLIYYFYGRKHSVMSRHPGHEIAAHGVSPGGQAVGDPDAPPDSPARPVNSQVDKK